MKEQLHSIADELPQKASVELVIQKIIMAVNLRPIFDWLLKQAQTDDYILVQGDFGVVYFTVNFAFQNGLIPIYSTTQRKAVENKLPDGSVQLQHTF